MKLYKCGALAINFKPCVLFFSVLLSTYGDLVAQSNLNSEVGYKTVHQQNGPVLGYCSQSAVHILKVKNQYFKDLNRNGKLDKYEDWRLSFDERASDLAKRLSIDEIAGLMLYSSHQPVPATGAKYGGMFYKVGKTLPYVLSDQQKKFLVEDHVRHILVTQVQSPAVAARWSNNVQALVESLGHGIPANNSSDPRHKASSNAEFDAGAGGKISIWPDGLAMAATFDPSLVHRFGEVAAQEYRALGITTALSPQVDLATEPRWYRTYMTYGEHPYMTRDMGRAYIDGFQTSSGKAEINGGWGYKSVNAMVKHWPGGGPEEAGRDAHWAYGKFAVYPGKNFALHLLPFTEGAFKLAGKTKMASALMPYYTVSYDQDPSGKNVGNGFSKYLITDLLREKYRYEGVVCTDWAITHDEGQRPDIVKGKPWGVEHLNEAQRHLEAILAGVDQFGGNIDKKPVIEAYQMGSKAYGEKFMRDRFERSAKRLLLNIFRVGLFENPYLNPQESQELVGNPAFMKEGYDAQLKSIVLLKNRNNTLPVQRQKLVYIPKMYYAPEQDVWSRRLSAPNFDYPIDTALVKRYFTLTDDPKKADFAMVFITNPKGPGGGYDARDRAEGGNGYIPIPLQYSTYTAHAARKKSIAAGDPVIDSTVLDRSYTGKTITAVNTMDLRTVKDTKLMMGEKPVIVVARLWKPMVMDEFEKDVDAILVNFGVLNQAVFDITAGQAEPSGLLPLQMPMNMETVEKQNEDTPFDMEPHRDELGHRYDFGFGLNWKGVIYDERNKIYNKKL